MVGSLVSSLVGRSVGQLVVWSAVQSVGKSVVRSVGGSVSRLADCLKGLCHENFLFEFFISHFLLVFLEVLDKDFKFLGIFMVLFKEERNSAV